MARICARDTREVMMSAESLIKGRIYSPRGGNRSARGHRAMRMNGIIGMRCGAVHSLSGVAQPIPNWGVRAGAVRVIATSAAQSMLWPSEYVTNFGEYDSQLAKWWAAWYMSAYAAESAWIWSGKCGIIVSKKCPLVSAIYEVANGRQNIEVPVISTVGEWWAAVRWRRAATCWKWEMYSREAR
jgi:hypothetical protein